MMQADDIRAILAHEPFVPLKLFKKDGKALDIPFKHVLIPMKSGVIVFKGIESATSHFARDGYEHVNYASIDRLEPRPGRRPRGRNGKDGGPRAKR